MLKPTRKSEHLLCVHGNIVKMPILQDQYITKKIHNGIVHRNTQSNNDICKEPQKILNSQSNPEHNEQN